MPILIAIYTFFTSSFGLLATWLSGAWVAATTWISSIFAIRIVLYTLLVAAFISIHYAFTQALISVIPDFNTVVTQNTTATGSTSLTNTLVNEFWKWLAFIKPPHLEAYIGSIASAALALYIFKNALFVLQLKSEVLTK